MSSENLDERKSITDSVQTCLAEKSRYMSGLYTVKATVNNNRNPTGRSTVSPNLVKSTLVKSRRGLIGTEEHSPQTDNDTTLLCLEVCV